MIFIKLTDRQQEQTFAYRLSGKIIVADQPIAELNHLSIATAKNLKMSPIEALEIARQAPLVFDEPGWIGNAWRHVTCYADRSGYRLEVEGVGRFAVAEDGNNIFCLQNAGQTESHILITTVLGAPLILALAIKGTWCLHASSIIQKDRLILFMGESGRGKSTLARTLANDPIKNLIRASDDILPIKLKSNSLVALPHFPQLKLGADAQLDPYLPESFPVAAIYVLEQAAQNSPVATAALTEKEALLAFVKHSVASLLFDHSGLARHLEFCAAAAKQVPIYRLIYPHRSEAIAEVAAQINVKNHQIG